MVLLLFGAKTGQFNQFPSPTQVFAHGRTQVEHAGGAGAFFAAAVLAGHTPGNLQDQFVDFLQFFSAEHGKVLAAQRFTRTVYRQFDVVLGGFAIEPTFQGLQRGRLLASARFAGLLFLSDFRVNSFFQFFPVLRKNLIKKFLLPLGAGQGGAQGILKQLWVVKGFYDVQRSQHRTRFLGANGETFLAQVATKGQQIGTKGSMTLQQRIGHKLK